MARHRKKMQDHVINTESSIESLREENHELEVRLHLLQYISTTQTTPWLVVSEYFRLFRLAVTAPLTANDHSTDLATNSGYGPEALLDDYDRLSTYHSGLDVQLLSLENSSEDIMTAATQMKISFTAITLQNAFLHLINEPELWKSWFSSQLLELWWMPLASFPPVSLGGIELAH